MSCTYLNQDTIGGDDRARSIMVVDDEADIRSLIEDYLTQKGFAVTTASCGAAMRAQVSERSPDLVILDLRMPNEDGLSLARWLRERTNAGVLVLSAVDESTERILTLELAADDFMSKPFHPRELLARVKSVLRRTGASEQPAQAASDRWLRLGCCWLDPDSWALVSDDGRVSRLSPTEVELLRAFLSNASRVLTRDELLSFAGDRHVEPFDRSIDMRINRLRRKIERDARKPEIVRTVRGVGYAFDLPTRTVRRSTVQNVAR